jgi:RNA recognition motif-containing protein
MMFLLERSAICLYLSKRNVIKLLGKFYFLRKESMEGSKLYVGNFTYSTTDTQLEELFGQFGEVKSANVIGDKGFGFVEMSSSEEAEKAKEALNETDFGGRTLRVDEARPQKPRSDRNFGGRY